ncbi:hypothetical protein PISL3812_08865 [Talaromyces islandicus]|uniref:Aldehyde dehydrogenase n=1 Tax=Talaromyces islandicus TaxID=28573 RepID=A0A0U1M9U2_TALIS|nr:hypothetical protein PISL3812_08865 [Talaromyces islandicus]
MASTYTTAEQADDAYTTLRATFNTGRTKSIPWRKWQLKQLWWLVADNKSRLLDALHADLNKHSYESTFTECSAALTEILDHLEHIDDWTAPKRPEGASFSTAYLMGATVRPEPRGLVLIIGPWNFPVHLMLLPLVAAITAGCTVLLKPSELATATQACLADLIPQYMDTGAIRVITGGPTETARLLQKQFDHIFFTGSPAIARHVSIAAAKHLTPTVLELGGQGPSIVTDSADVDFAAKSIASSKHINAGQICVAVNHVLVHPSIAEKLVERMQFYLKDFSVDGSDSMAKIINRKHFDRLKTVIDTTNGSIAYGGVTNHDTLKIHPTILTDIKVDDPSMKEEIFGPICPVLVATTEEAIQLIKSKPHPLAMYIFSQNRKEIDHIIASTASGGVTINDTLVHSAVPGAPFGGVGESGYGAYHGIHGFREFSHMRNIAEPGAMLSAYFALRFPPYSQQDPSNVEIKNRLGFKRGETIADQEVGPLRALWKNYSRISLWTVVLAILVVLADKGAGGWLGLWWLTMRVRLLILSVEGSMRRNVAGLVPS